jgi:ferrous iron transport protein B
LTDLLAEGVMAGIGGIVIFVPQIAFLFLFISLLEESGYMSRVVFLMDRLMRPFGLSGKSLVPLISGTACAIPAVMATRTIEDWKERLITILVTPFTTCSARLPVYLIVISLVIPQTTYLGLSFQALTLMALYALGFIAALLAAALLNKTVKVKKRTLFVVEMPHYKMPLFKNVALTVVEKTKSFVLGAGKIILALSIVLWFMGSNGWSEAFQNAEQHVQERPEVVSGQWDQTRIDQEISSYKLEHSLIGQMGKTIEPVVRPLGFDWKMGIAIITSFAAREVFVGTLATLYAVGSDEGETIKQRMASERDPVTGAPLFNLASGISLLLFYAFAMQCMSTLAVVKRETNSWYWPAAQLIVMSSIAYLLALIAYQTLS